MSTVMTVAGPITADQLGRTLVHEHVRISYPGDHLDPTSNYDRANWLSIACERMEQLLDAGVRTFVDPCPIELGRDPELLAEVAQRTGMQLICATGFYMEHDAIGIPYYWRQRWEEEIAEYYLHEIEHGIGSTGIHPGVIKVATGDPLGEHERKVVHGAATAAKDSGLPIVTHTEHSTNGDFQQDVFEEVGVDLSRCLIGHQDEARDSNQLVAIAKRGSFVGVDRIGLEILAPDEQRLDHVECLVESGHADRVCLSQDHMCFTTGGRPAHWVPKERAEWYDREVRPKVVEQAWGRPHTYLFTNFLPRLQERGIGGDVIDSILIDNPRRLLAGE